MSRRALLVAAIVLGAARTAHADKDLFLDGSTGRVDPGELRLGLWRVDYGLPGRAKDVQIGTATWPYLTYAVDITSANVVAKYEPWHDRRWRTSIESGLTYIRFDDQDTAVRTFLVPTTALASYHPWRRFTFVGGAALNVASSAAAVQDDRYRGALIGSSFQIPLAVELRAASWLQIALRRNILLYQGVSADIDADLDAKTHAHAYAVNEIQNPLTHGSEMLEVLFGGRRVGFRLGVGLGDIEIPAVHFIVPFEFPVPYLDLYWRI